MMRTLLLTTSLVFVTFAASAPQVSAATQCEGQNADITPSIIDVSCSDIQCYDESEGLGIMMVQSLPGGIGGSVWCHNTNGSATCFGVIYCSRQNAANLQDDDASCEGYGSSGFLGIMLVWIFCYNVPCSANCVTAATATTSQPRVFDLDGMGLNTVPQIGDLICSPAAGCTAILPNSASMLVGDQGHGAFACDDEVCRSIPANCIFGADTFDCAIGSAPGTARAADQALELALPNADVIEVPFAVSESNLVLPLDLFGSTTQSQAAAAAGPGCTAGPTEDFCTFTCNAGDTIAVSAFGLSGGVLGDCGGRSAQCIVDNGGGQCVDTSSTLLYRDVGYCGHTGADLAAAAVWTTVIQCVAGPI